ncbi:MAG: hypothetical protein J6T10_30145 [Methanobrevibacter sp.]|nr:hypothetical protein [Methanobrevibacter sp.]
MKNNEKLVEENRLLKEELQQRVDDNASIYAMLCNALMRLQEADEILFDFMCHPYPQPITYEMREKLEKYHKKYEISEKST